jgi:hypothetical protein
VPEYEVEGSALVSRDLGTDDEQDRAVLKTVVVVRRIGGCDAEAVEKILQVRRMACEHTHGIEIGVRKARAPQRCHCAAHTPGIPKNRGDRPWRTEALVITHVDFSREFCLVRIYRPTRSRPIKCQGEASAKEDAGKGKHIGHAKESGCGRNRPAFETRRGHKKRVHICEKSWRLM